MQVLEGAQYRLRVKLTNAAGELLPPEFFLVYAGAFCPGCAPVRFHAERTAEEWVLTMPGLKPGRVPWNWQVIAAEYATGVEWLLAGGEVNVTPRLAAGSGCVDPGELVVVATLDKTTLQMAVQIGESTAACSLAVVDARNSAKEADASAKLAAGSANYAAEQAQAAETARKQADGCATNAANHAADAHGSATAADTSAKEADAAATNAADQATRATEQATSATTARKEADAAALAARAHAADAQTSSKASADSASESIGAAEKAAEASAIVAEQADRAEGFAEAAGVARAGAEAAKAEAEAALGRAEEHAAIATAAAEAAQAPESIAAQAARPATMLLVKDELQSILGDVSLFDIDTDGHKIIVHTDRLNDGQLAEVSDMLARFVPQFVEVEQYNHHIDVSWREVNKYAECVTVADLLAVNTDVANDVTSDGFWGFPLSKFNDKIIDVLKGTKGINHLELYLPEQLGGLKSNSAYTITGIQTLSIYAPKYRGEWAAFWWASPLEKAHLYIPSATIIPEYISGCKKLEEITGDFSAASNARMFASQCLSLMRCEVEFPRLSDGSNMFSGCLLDKASVLCILKSVPPYDGGEHLLTLGMHTDNEADEEVRAAIDAAAARGWTVIEQWNGTPTASTFALRPAPPVPVYAKEDTLTDAEGNERPVLNWCHNVTSPDGREPEELGYTLFESVEEAREYFGIQLETENN